MAKKKAKTKTKVTRKKAQIVESSTRKKMGRPKSLEGRMDEMKALMRLKPSLEDTAAFFECSARTVEQAIRDEYDLTFREFRSQNFVHTRLQLQRDAITKSKTDWNAHKFCLENLCGWGSNKTVQHEGNPDRPIQVSSVDWKERANQIKDEED